MRIVILSWKDDCHPLAGGSEVLIDRLALGLHERGHDVTLVCGGPIREHAYRTIDAGGSLQQFATDPFLVRRRLPDADVIVDVCNGLAFYSPLWSGKPVVALVNHIHAGMWHEWFSRPVAWAGWTLETRVMPRAYRHELVAAVSESTARALESIGVARDRIRVVHNGVDLPSTSTDRSPAPTFVALGRLVPHKRFDLLLRAWRRVYPETGGTLVVAGDGPLREELERTAPPSTQFVGRIDHDAKVELLGRSWLLVQPSRLEGWGLVVLEAAACGTPTLGFDVPGTRDAVVHDESGILVATEDELVARWIELANDDEQREVLAKGARRRAEAFAWARTVERFEAVLDEAIARPRRRRFAGVRRAAQRARQAAELFRLFLAEKHDPEPFYRRSAERAIEAFPFEVRGLRILDLGSGAGYFTDELRAAGAEVHPVELDASELARRDGGLAGAVQADATRLPYPDGCFDGVFCSNMLEHTPAVPPVLREVGRVVRPGGWAWVSWTNWYSPWGGHEIVPFHYLGPRLGLWLWRALFGEPRKNVPFVELWPTHIGDVLRAVRAEPTLDASEVFPRYYPSQRWITKVPGVREVLTWNCVLLLTRRDVPVAAPAEQRAS